MEVSGKNTWKILNLILILISAGCSMGNNNFGAVINDEKTESDFTYITVELRSEFKRDEGSNYTLDGSINPENLEAFYDFDSGSTVASDAADIYFYVSCGSDCFNILKAINNASVVWQGLGETEPTYEQCLDTFSSERAIQLLDAVPSHYSCLRTNSGNIVLIQVIESGGDINHGILILKYVMFP